MSKKKATNPIEEEMAEIYAKIKEEPVKVEPKEVVEIKEENNMEVLEEEVKNEVVAPKVETAMRVPTPTDVKVVPDESLEIYNKIKEGYTQAEIRTMYARWKAKKFRTIWANAQALISKDITEAEEARATAILRYTDLYKQAYAIGNIKEAKNILDSLCKVQGLNRDVTLNADFVTVWKQ